MGVGRLTHQLRRRQGLGRTCIISLGGINAEQVCLNEAGVKKANAFPKYLDIPVITCLLET